MTDRKNWKTGLSIGKISEKALEKAAEASLDAVEICGIDGNDSDWKKVPGWAKNTGVEVWSFHLPFDWKIPIDPSSWDPTWWKKCYDADTELIYHMAEAGIKVAVIHPSLEPIPDFMRESLISASIEHLGILSEFSRKNGIILTAEDLPRTCLGNCSTELLRYVEAIPDLRICFDVNHLLTGETHEEFISAIGKYIVTTHISDYDFTDEKHWFPMEGKIDWKSLQENLEKTDYSGPFLYETMPAGKTWADVKKNREELMKL